MIQLERSRSTPISEQLVEQLRYLIASDQYKPGDALPSTRALGEQLSISFHTVRKAYQVLVQEGYLTAKKGSGYLVQGRAPLGTQDRTERSAAILSAAFQQVIALGFDAADLEPLVAEQLDLLDAGQTRYRTVVTAPSAELADMLASHLRRVTTARIDTAQLSGLSASRDADFVIAPFIHLRSAVEALPSADVRGVPVQLSSDALAKAARLLDHHTLVVVAAQSETLAPLAAHLRRESAYGGQIIALPLDAAPDALRDLAAQADLILYTPACHRRLANRLGGTPALPIGWHLGERVLRSLTETLPL